jgi:hypothetical protein
MHKSMIIVSVLVVTLGLVTFGLAADSGDTGERDLAEDVKEAFAKGDAVEIFEYFTDEKKAEEIRMFDASIQSLKDSERAERESAIEDFNDYMWWDTDWQKVKEITDFDEFGEMDKIKFQLRKFREYASLERVKDFQDRISDLRLVVYKREHSTGLDDWGNATIEYANKWNDRVIIVMAQRGGEWFVSDLKVSGFPLRTIEQTEKARKSSK